LINYFPVGTIPQSGAHINTCGKLPYIIERQVNPDPKTKKQPPLTIALSKEAINESPNFCFIMKVKAE
jgi:hypothetical protein